MCCWVKPACVGWILLDARTEVCMASHRDFQSTTEYNCLFNTMLQLQECAEKTTNVSIDVKPHVKNIDNDKHRQQIKIHVTAMVMNVPLMMW
jgi:hypothetical protein